MASIPGHGEAIDLPRDDGVRICTCTSCDGIYRSIESALSDTTPACGPFELEVLERVYRPFPDQYDSVEAFTDEYERHTRYQSKTKGYPAHADQEYPLVVDCPDCDHIATVCQLSSISDPLWRCRSSEHTYLESKYRAGDLDINDVKGCTDTP